MRYLRLILARSPCSLSQTTFRRTEHTSVVSGFDWTRLRRIITSMTPRKDSLPHETRTSAEPRQNKLYTVRLAHIEQINPSVRLLRLLLPAEEPLDEEAAVCLLPPRINTCISHAKGSKTHIYYSLIVKLKKPSHFSPGNG